jgi:hypothetical protein
MGSTLCNYSSELEVISLMFTVFVEKANNNNNFLNIDFCVILKQILIDKFLALRST